MTFCKKIAAFYILIIGTNTSYAGNNTVEFPEAYNGLNADAYHLLELNQSKSDGLSFQLNDHSISVDLNKSAVKTVNDNLSFSQTIPNGTISATYGENSLFGEMHLDNKHYILTTNAAGIWAVELPHSGLHFNDCGLNHEHPETVSIAEQPITFPDKAAGTVIDVLIIYDQAIADRYPGHLLQNRVDQYFHVANQTYANSNLDLALRQVGLSQVNYNYDDSNQHVRDLLQGVLAGVTLISGLETVPEIRAETGADLVIFLRTHNIEKRGNCGIAFFPVSDQQGSLNHSYGINVMSDGISSWSICTDQLMVHEIGHNLGAGHHNWDPTEYDYYAEARGFAKIGQYGTVMGSFATGQADRFYELDYFSNPSIQCGGAPCGVPGLADNVSVINLFKTPVAGYLNSVSTAPAPQDYELSLTDLDGDGVLDDVDQFPFDASESTDSDGDGVGNNSDVFPNDTTEVSDFDQDGTGDFSDPDTDNDGVLNSNDRFPFDPTEFSDSDHDYVGDNTDHFPNEPSETQDTDGDSIGNNTDEDDDNDGVIDINYELQDLLVISVGNNRMLRFDAQTGLSKGIEVLPSDGLFTFQSDMVYDDKLKRLYFTSASSIRSLDLMNPYAEPTLLVSPYANAEISTQLLTGFPTALAIDMTSALSNSYNADLFFAKLRGNDIRGFTVHENFTTSFDFPFFSEFAEGENIIDIENANGQHYFQGQLNSIYKSNGSVFASEILGNGNYTWLDDPYALVATSDGRLLHSDQGRNRILITDATTGEYGGIFAELSTMGYSNPTGMDITDDGRLLVAVSDQNTILEFNVETSEFLGELVSGLGLDQPHRILLVPQLRDRFHQDANKVLRPNAGNWYNPATSGRGFNIGVFDNRLQVLWFTYDTDSNPIWYTAADFLNGHSFDTALLKTKLNNDETFSVETIGSINIEFTNEREAQMYWQIGEESGQEPINWLQFSLEPETVDYTGMWSHPDAPGWGTAMINNGDKTVAIPFIYDDDGQPRWLISDVAEGVQPFAFNMNAFFSDTLCPTCSGEPITQTVSVGTMSFDLSNQAYWDSDVNWPTPLSGSWQLNQTELVRISSEPTKPR